MSNSDKKEHKNNNNNVWITLIIVGGLLILMVSCLVIWYLRNTSYQIISKSDGYSKESKIPEFQNLKQAQDAYMNLYNQIGSFCKTVKSPMH